MPSLRNFVGRVAAEQLGQFLATHSIEPLDQTASPTSIVDHIEQCLNGRGPGARSKLLEQIETIQKLASEVGERAIASLPLAERVPELPSREAKALWLYLNNPEGFYRAEECERNDTQRYGRLWSAFSGPAGCDLRRDEAAQQAFKEALRVQFDTPNVHLDIFDRNTSRQMRTRMTCGLCRSQSTEKCVRISSQCSSKTNSSTNRGRVSSKRR